MTEEQKGQEKPKQRRSKSDKVTLLKNIKYKQRHYKIGEEIEIDAADREGFIKTGIIKGE